jgi:GTPase SAR1 family protein
MKFNILMAGLQSSGKTTIVQRYLSNNNSFHRVFSATTSLVDHKVGESNAHIWDVPGCSGVDLDNLRGANAIIYVIDGEKTNPADLQADKASVQNIIKYQDMIREHAPITFVISKNDSENPEQTSIPLLLSAVKQEIITPVLAGNAKCVAVSANANAGITQLFEDILALRPKQETMDDEKTATARPKVIQEPNPITACLASLFGSKSKGYEKLPVTKTDKYYVEEIEKLANELFEESRSLIPYPNKKRKVLKSDFLNEILTLYKNSTKAMNLAQCIDQVFNEYYKNKQKEISTGKRVINLINEIKQHHQPSAGLLL